MPAIDYPEAVKVLIHQLKQLPGIGPKSAERAAVWIMQQGAGTTGPFAAALQEAGAGVVECEVCGFFATKGEGCTACDSSRDEGGLLCVVEQATDILPLERSGAFRGHYHSLRGRISPLDNVGPEQLRIRELIDRLASGAFTEVILALSYDVEGEATSNYLAEVISACEGVRVTRLAQGLPAGGGLGSADELTLMRALQGRVGL